MNLSYWEQKEWLSNIDFTIVGSGIVGLCTALFLKQRFPNSKIVVLERGILPQGASTKNAGFACFGSLSELIDDMEAHSADEVLELLKKRVEGLKLLRQLLGDDQIGYQAHGGYELFLKKDLELYNSCIDQMNAINSMLTPVFKENVFSLYTNKFNFNGVLPNYLYNKFESQIDTGKMMQSLLLKAQSLGVLILNGVNVDSFQESNNTVHIKTNQFEFESSQMVIATNGFSNKLLELDLKPARAQVLVTKPINALHIKGTFHFDRGYYYFRNINNRILFGGGRNLDFANETTTAMATTSLIQSDLETILKTIILPNTKIEIEQKWSGIMGIGHHKTPIVRQYSNRVFIGVRMGGMGIALGAAVAKAIANLVP